MEIQNFRFKLEISEPLYPEGCAVVIKNKTKTRATTKGYLKLKANNEA